MHIGLDVDGVLTDFEWFINTFGSKYLSSVGKNGTIVASGEYDFSRRFGCCKKDEVGFYKRYLMWYITRMPIRENAAQVIKALKENKKSKISIITARIFTDRNDVVGRIMKSFLIFWLKANGVQFDNIYFVNTLNSANEKAEIAKKIKLDFFVEDDPQNILQISKYCKVICIRAKYNENIDNVLYATDFGEVFQHIIGTNISFLPYEKRNNLEKAELIEYFHYLSNYYYQMPFDFGRLSVINRNYLLVKAMGSILFSKVGIEIQYVNKNIEEVIIDNSIFVCNHRRSFDIPICWYILRKVTPRLLIKQEYKCSFPIGNILSSFGAVFVDREDKNSGRAAQNIMIQTLLNNGSVLIFPEGTRNRTEKKLLPFKYGAVYIAQVTGRPIIPIALYRKDSRHYICSAEKPFYVHPEESLEQKNIELQNIIYTMLCELEGSEE